MHLFGTALLLLLLLSTLQCVVVDSSASGDGDSHKLRRKAVLECCGDAKGRVSACCRKHLFRSWTGDRAPMSPCAEEFGPDGIVRVIHCAQHIAHNNAADICKIGCCSFLENFDRPSSPQSSCSRLCQRLAQLADMTVDRQMRALRRHKECAADERGRKVLFTAFEECIRSDRSTPPPLEAGFEVCEQLAGEQ